MQHLGLWPWPSDGQYVLQALMLFGTGALRRRDLQVCGGYACGVALVAWPLLGTLLMISALCHPSASAVCRKGTVAQDGCVFGATLRGGSLWLHPSTCAQTSSR